MRTWIYWLIIVGIALSIGGIVGIWAAKLTISDLSTPETTIKPINQLITPAKQEWIDAYGDTLETQIVYNLVVLRNNDFVIANTINKMHEKDPNEPTLEARIKKLEDSLYIIDE